LFGALLWQRRWSAAALFAIGCLPGIALQGWLDVRATGDFLATPWAYFRANVVDGVAQRFGVEPWWFYAALVLPMFAVVPPFLRVSFDCWRRGAARFPGLFAAGVFHLAAHSFVARKAMRFELGALVMLVAVVAAGLATSGGGGHLVRWHRRVVVTVQIGLLAWASFWFGHAGAIRAGLFVRDLPPSPALLVVDGDVTSLAGVYYGGPVCRTAGSVFRDRLLAHLTTRPLADGTIVVAVRSAIDGALPGGRLDLLAVCAGCLDLRRRDRRYVYRWSADRR
jgi:hypothetical protein